MKDGEIYGDACAVADLKKNGLDEQVKRQKNHLFLNHISQVRMVVWL